LASLISFDAAAPRLRLLDARIAARRFSSIASSAATMRQPAVPVRNAVVADRFDVVHWRSVLGRHYANNQRSR
jgi:hypothetical protein